MVPENQKDKTQFCKTPYQLKNEIAKYQSKVISGISFQKPYFPQNRTHEL
jgi:hypothetical protein